jgi:bifunctional non-homologous end joining protein LigD
MAITKIKKSVSKENAGKKKNLPVIADKRKVNISALIQSAPKEKFPVKLTPMLATLVDKPFEENGWLYEVKWDGYRALAFCNKGSVELKSRNDKSFNDKFYPILKAVKDWNINAIIDGEIVVIGDNGISNFGALQNWRSEADGELFFYVFDIIWFDGKDLSLLPLTERKAILKSIVPKKGIIKLSESFDGSGTKFFETAKASGLEGIIAKKADSVYLKGDRSNLWLKVNKKRRHEQTV